MATTTQTVNLAAGDLTFDHTLNTTWSMWSNNTFTGGMIHTPLIYTPQQPFVHWRINYNNEDGTTRIVEERPEEFPKHDETQHQPKRKMMDTPIPTFEGEAVAVEVEIPEGCTEEYMALATKLGVANYETSKMLFKRFLQEQEICVYDLESVQAYLTERCKYLNERDGYDASSAFSGVRWAWDWHGVHPGQLSNQFNDVMPIEAMRVMDRVQSGFPDAKNMTWGVAKIFKDPDPFLGVLYEGDWYVLFHWQEPGFSVVK
jgi:hypothetical protein